MVAQKKKRFGFIKASRIYPLGTMDTHDVEVLSTRMKLQAELKAQLCRDIQYATRCLKAY